ncbi:MAG: response regulator, partial [Planctomycetaceae bacterium]|nr:response regulator [Planctomycetaceae bacterium]
MALSKKILLIEDDRDISSTLRGVLESSGHKVVAAPNGIEGQKLVQSEKPDLVITDMMMPRMGGFPVLEFLRTLDNPPKVIMITANE